MGTYWDSFLEKLNKELIRFNGKIASIEQLSPAELLEAFFKWLNEKGKIKT